MNGWGFRLLLISSLRYNLRRCHGFFEKIKKLRVGAGARPPAFTLNFLRYNLRRSHGNHKDFNTFSNVEITEFSLMQQPVSIWLTLPSSGRLVFDISSRAISIVFLLRNNLNLASLFIIL